MNCRYIYKSKSGTTHEFRNEIELDDFLLSKHKYENKFGDLVFLISTEGLLARANAEKIAEQTKELKKKVKDSEYVDEELIEHFDKPFIGVTKYLSEFRDDFDKPLFPIFTSEEYWKRRRIYWTDKTQDLNEEYTADKGSGVYTKEERELIFENELPRWLNKDEMDCWEEIIKQKWKQQGLLGEDIHHILEMFFRKYDNVPNFVTYKTNRRKFIELIKKHLDLDENIISTVLDYGYILLEKIKEEIGDTELEFYPELKISGDLSEPRQDGITSLVGSIDLLVVDSVGNSYIFDYKTSPKEYDKFDDAKVRTFMYQFATYNRLLLRFGFKDTNNRLYVLPLKFENYRLSNRDEAIQNPEKAKFIYDNISWDESGMIRDLTPKIKTDDNLNAHLNSFLPAVKLSDVDSDKIVERVVEDENNLFGGQYKKKSYSDEEIRDLLKDVKPDEKGRWVFTLKGGYMTTPIVADNSDALFLKVKELFKKFENSDLRRCEVIVDLVKESRKKGFVNADEAFKMLSAKKLFDETGDLQFLKRKILPYLEDSSWDVVEDPAIAHFGCVVFKNKYTKLVDVLKLSGKNLDYRLYHEKYIKTADGLNKAIKNSRRGNLTFNFEADIEEQQNKDSGMLLGTIGNVESIEVLLLLNQKQSIFEGDYKIGNIQIVNPFTSLASKAPNWQLEYSYKKLRKHQKIYEGIDHINDGEIKFASLLDIVENDFKLELNKDNRAFGESTGEFQSSLTVLDSAEDNQEKLAAVEKLLALLRKKYPSLTEQLKSNDDSRISRLYNRLLLAAAELRGIKFKLQIEKNDKYPKLNITKALKHGLSSSYIDNPGNLDSETLNMLTQIVTEGYQNIRTDLANDIPKVRELTDKLKKSKNFGWLKLNTVGNQVSIFKNMFNTNITDDLVLKRISDMNSPEEKEFAKYFLRTVNRNRFPNKSEVELLMMEDNYDINYYRVPLAKGSISSEVAMRGVFNTLKSRLSNWTPTKALKELRALAEGLFTDNDVLQIDQAESDLFEMNNKFSKGDSNEEYRLDSIKENGLEYFEHDLETLLLEHMFAYKTKKHLDKIFPMLRATMTHLKVSGEDEMNRQFTSDLDYAKDYIKAVVKSLPIDKNLKDMELRAMATKLRQAASFVALAFSPVQALYQSIQGLWVDISLIIRKPDGTQAFTFANFSKAFKIVYADLFPWTELPSKVKLLNELYAVNDMDMNTYMKNVKSNQGGIFNAYDLAFKFTSRPDYYNRMTILVAQMIHEGTWDAYKVVDGKLVYDFNEDKRFQHFIKGDKSHAKYDYERGLYYAIAELHMREGAKNPDGSLFKVSLDKIIPLPQAHTIQEIESFKALGDLIYGYYSHEKKSLIHYQLLGAMFMLMRTYWSGKKNQYLAPGGVRIQGKWVQAKDKDGKGLYYQVIDGKIRTDLPPVIGENTGAPVVQWQGLWQEGIMVTLSSLASGMYDYMRDGDYNIFEAFKNAVEEKYHTTEDMERAYKNNIRQLTYDLTLYAVIGIIAAGALADWDKELTKEAKDNGDIVSGIYASMLNILTMSVRNSAADFAFWESIGNPALLWTPFSFDTGGRIFKNIWNTAMGDRTFWGGVTNTFAVTKQFKPLMLNIAPLTEPKE